jgi:hypothetical protein
MPLAAHTTKSMNALHYSREAYKPCQQTSLIRSLTSKMKDTTNYPNPPQRSVLFPNVDPELFKETVPK